MNKEVKIGISAICGFLSLFFIYKNIKSTTSENVESSFNKTQTPPQIISDNPSTNRIKKDVELITKKYTFKNPNTKIHESCIMLSDFTLHQLEYNLAALEESEKECYGKTSNALKELLIECQTDPYTQNCLLGVAKFQAESINIAINKLINNFDELDTQDQFRVLSAQATVNAINGDFNGTQTLALSMLNIYPDNPNVQNFVITSTLIDSKSNMNIDLIKDMVKKSTDSLGSKPLITYAALINSQNEMDSDTKKQNLNWIIENYPESEAVDYISFTKNMELQNYQAAKKSLELGLEKNPENKDFSNNLKTLNECMKAGKCKGVYFNIESLGQIPRIEN